MGQKYLKQKEIMNQVNELFTLLKSIENPIQKEHPKGWTIAEVVGHLIDSATNNHNRFLRYSTSGTVEFPGYDQDESVVRCNYKEMDFKLLSDLWYNYNLLILNTLEAMPSEAFDCKIKVGDSKPVTFQFLKEDYFAHMQAHELQINRILSS